MELEVSEEEVEASDTEHMEEGEELSSLQEEGLFQKELIREAITIEEQLINKCQKRKNKWGPTLMCPRSRRQPEDGRTMLEKAQEFKKIKNLEQVLNTNLLLLLKAVQVYLKKLILLIYLWVLIPVIN